MLPYYIICALVGYLIGSIPFGYIIVKLAKGIDIRTVGSGNIGATNVARVMGWPVAILCFLCDSLKGSFAIFISSLLWRLGYLPPFIYEEIAPITLVRNIILYITISGTSAIVGHLFSIYLRFKGGKGVATAFGVFIILITVPTIIASIIWVVFVILFRYISLASIVAVISLPITFCLLNRGIGGIIIQFSFEYAGLLISALMVTILIVIKHIPNIKRLIAGTEPKVKFSRSKDDKINS